MGKKCTGLVLGTVNITGAGSLVKLEPCARAADIWCVQEVKLEEDDTEGSVKFQITFERWGFQAKIEPCVTTDQGKSSGVAIAWKPWVRVRIPYTVFPGRVLAVQVLHPTYGEIVVYCIYAPQGGCMKSLDMYKAVFADVQSHGKPFVVAGDHNIEPDGMRLLLQQVDGLVRDVQVVCPSKWTCKTNESETIIDYFMADSLLVQVVTSVEVHDEHRVAVHRPVTVTMNVDAGDVVVPVWRQVPAGEPDLIVGPQPHFSDEGWRRFESECTALEACATITSEQVDHLGTWWEELAHEEGCLKFARSEQVQVGREFQVKKMALSAALCTKESERAVPSLAHGHICCRAKEYRTVASQGDLMRLRDVHKAWCRDKVWTFYAKHLSQHKNIYDDWYAWVAQLDPRSRGAEWFAEDEQKLKLIEEGQLDWEKKEWRISRDEWQTWKHQALEGAASAGHKFAKVKDLQEQRLAKGADGRLSLSLTDQLSEQRGKLADLWQCERAQAPRGPVQLHPDWGVPLISVAAARQASRSFKKATTHVDGWHPRQYKDLGDPALRCLCLLFRVYEATAYWARAQQSLILRLIKKPDGDLRPILWFRSAYRLFGKIRSVEVREWRAKNLSDVEFNNLNGQGIGNEIWRSAVRNSIRGESDDVEWRFVLEALWDISKAFDRVSHQRLRELARELNYPLSILALSLHSYTWSRRLVIDKVTCDELRPFGGVGPGSPFAVDELALYLARDVRRIASVPGMRINLHVDDFTVTGEGDNKHHLVRRFSIALASLVDGVETDKQMLFSKSKAHLLANCHDVLESAVKVLGVWAGDVGQQVRRLGYDYSVVKKGVRPCAGRVFKHRWLKNRLRVRRILKLASRSTRPGKLFYAGALPGVLYGAELWGTTSRIKRQLRGQAAKVLGMRAKGVSHELLWGVLPSASDPAAKADWLPVARYGDEVWAVGTKRSVLSEDVLAAAYKVAVRDKCGPIWVVMKALEAGGWTLADWRTIVTAKSMSINLQEHPPPAYKAQFFEAYRDGSYDAWWNGWKTRHHREEGRPDIVALRQWVKDPKISRLSKLQVIKAHAGVVPTATKLKEWGALLNGSCGLCGADDTFAHRLWTCRGTEQVRLDLPSNYIAWFRDGDSYLQNQGHWAAPRVVDRRPVDLRYEIVGHTADGVAPTKLRWLMDRPVYLDGSCFNNKCHGYESAGASAVQVDEQGIAVMGAIAAVPATMPQTSMAGEHVAVILFRLGAETHVSSEALTAVADCQTVVRDWGCDLKTASKRRYGAVWRDWQGGCKNVQKVKAHTSKQQAEVLGQGHHWAGNVVADAFAKKAALKHLVPDEITNQVLHGRAMLKRHYRHVTAVTAMFNEQEVTADDVQWTRKSGHKKTKAHHQWEWDDGASKYRCVLCLRGVRGLGPLARSSTCKGLTGAQRGSLQRYALMQHSICRIVGVRGNVKCTFCRNCGCYTMGGKGSLLNERCRREASGQHRLLTKLLAGRHPKGKIRGPIIGAVHAVTLATRIFLESGLDGKEDNVVHRPSCEGLDGQHRSFSEVLAGGLPTAEELYKQLSELEHDEQRWLEDAAFEEDWQE